MKNIKILIILIIAILSVYFWYKSFTIFNILNKIQIWTYSSIVTIEKWVIHSEIALESIMKKLNSTKETTIDIKNKTEELYLKAKWLIWDNKEEIEELKNKLEKINLEKEKIKELKNKTINKKKEILEDKDKELKEIREKTYIFPYFMSILVSIWIFYLLTSILLKINNFFREIKNFIYD